VSKFSVNGTGSVDASRGGVSGLGTFDSELVPALAVREAGFSVHAATHAGAEDERGREALLKYVLRPPLATERLVPGPRRRPCEGSPELRRNDAGAPFSAPKFTELEVPDSSSCSSRLSANDSNRPVILRGVVDAIPRCCRPAPRGSSSSTPPA